MFLYKAIQSRGAISINEFDGLALLESKPFDRSLVKTHNPHPNQKLTQQIYGLMNEMNRNLKLSGFWDAVNRVFVES